MNETLNPDYRLQRSAYNKQEVLNYVKRKFRLMNGGEKNGKSTLFLQCASFE